MENDEAVGPPGEQFNDPPDVGVSQSPAQTGIAPQRHSESDSQSNPQPEAEPEPEAESGSGLGGDLPPWFPRWEQLWPSDEPTVLPEWTPPVGPRWHEPPRCTENDPSVFKTARDPYRFVDPADVLPTSEELRHPFVESDELPEDPFVPIPEGAVFVNVPFHDVPPSPPTRFAQVANFCSDLVDAIADVETLQARQAAWKAEFVDRACTLALSNEEGVIPGTKDLLERRDLAFRSFVAELACTLRIPERTATTLVEESQALMHRLPLTMEALRFGEISYRHAQQLVDQISTLTDEAAAELEGRVLPFARKMTAAQFRQKTRITRERLCPESAVERCVKSASDRRLEIIPAADGMAWLNLFTTAPLAETIFDTIRAQSMRLKSPTDPRTLAQLDADVTVDGLLESFTGEFSTPDPTGTRIFGTGLGTYRYDTEPPTNTSTSTSTGTGDGDAFRATPLPGTNLYRISCAGPGVDPVTSYRKIVPTVLVTVPVLTLLGKSDKPGNLDGYGPIDPQTARDLAAQAPEFHRILTHPETGVVLSLGNTKYTPSAAMRRFLRYRDGYCRFPGCNRRAVSCDIDHTDPFQTGGCTDIDNLASLCPKHHKMKHETEWHIEQLGNGVLKWTSPQGREYITHPENPARGPVPPANTVPADGETETGTNPAQVEGEPVTGRNKHHRDDSFDAGDSNTIDTETPPF